MKAKVKFNGMLALTLALMAMHTDASAALLFVNQGTTSGWDQAYTTGQSYCIEQSTAKVRSGSTSIRFEVRSDAQDNGGRYHSHVKVQSIGETGKWSWYGFSTYVFGFESSTSTVMQFFDKATRGEPAMMLEYNPYGDYHMIMSINYGNNQNVKRDLGYVAPNSWTDWVFRAKFSETAGVYEIWKNGTYVLRHDGPNIETGTQVLDFVVGVYANLSSWTLATNPVQHRVVYLDSIRVGDANSSYSEVAPR